MNEKREFKKNLIFTMYKDRSVSLALIRSLVDNDYDLAKEIYTDILNYQIDIYGEQLYDRTYLKDMKNYKSFCSTYDVEKKM